MRIAMWRLCGICCIPVLFFASPLAAKPADSPAPTSPSVWRADSPLGVGGYAYSHNFERPEAALLDGRETLIYHNLSGASWARQDFWWGLVNPQKDVWKWEYFDAAMDSYAQRGIRLLAILCYGSPWASAGDAPVDDAAREAFGEFVYQMVKRYGDRVGAWEIWNEPNILPFWSPRPDPKDYAALLEVAYRRAKQADPNAVVVGGVMAGPDPRFVEQFLDHGAAGHFDILSFHTYGQHPDERVLWGEAVGLHRLLARFNSDRPIWLTETGVYTGPAGLSEEEQAAALARVTLGLVGSGEVDKVFQLTLMDWSDDEKIVDATSFRGLLRKGGIPKIAYFVHRRLADALAGRTGLGWVSAARGVRGVALGDPRHPLLAFWTEPEHKDPISVSIPLGVPAINITHLLTGRQQLLRSETGDFALTLDRFPLLVEGCGVELGGPALLRMDPMPMEVVAGGSTRVQLRRHPFAGLGEPWQAVLEVPAQWSVEPKAFALAADGAPITVEIKAPLQVESVPSSLPLRVRSRDFADREVLIALELNLQPPFEADWMPITRLDLRKPEWPLRIQSRVANPLDLVIAWTCRIQKALPMLRASETRRTLKTQETFIAPYALPLEPGDLPATLTLQADIRLGAQKAMAEVQRKIIGFPKIAKPPVIDGKLDEWPPDKPTIPAASLHAELFNPALYGGPDDLASDAWFAWDDTFLYMAFRVRDDVICLPRTPTIWDDDCLQLGFDFGNDTPPLKGYDEHNDSELEIARLRDGTIFFDPHNYPPGRPLDPLIEKTRIAVEVSEENHEILYEIALPWAALPLPSPAGPGTVFAFNFILNDNDGHGRKGWLELAPGIGWGKDPAQFPLAWLLE